ncbi:hypothetical protein [Bifidobacterium sp. wkB344]|uniref:hypothetical protein n=1 Tax=Bifidobacterium sp. wkB344 TaxID=2025113 RepID=UPI0011C410DE|nr:hypothetical protein [Bifidobacterium sp. wkB344]
MSNNRNERANKNQGRHEGNSSRSDNTRESSQQTTMNDKNYMPKPVENANARKESQAVNAPKPKPVPEQTGEKEGRDSSKKDADQSRPEVRNKQEQAGHVDREHDGPSHDDKPSQPNKTAAKDAPVSVGKPSQPSVPSLPKPRKAKNHDSFYLGLASAVLVAALGLSLSTMPIFFSLPLAAVLFGIGIWLLSYASFKSPGKPEGEGTETDRHTRTVVVATVLLVLQTFIMDVFIFTRMGTVGKHQNAIVITWIIASMIETLAAFALIYHHNPLQSKPKESAANDKHEGKE